MMRGMSDTGDVVHADTTSLCSTCLAPVPAKVVLRAGRALLLKRCPTHGECEELLEEDADWYVRRLEFDKPGTKSAVETAAARGCPFDCGLCPGHEQHTCIGLVEVTPRCDLGCPVCYAGAGDRGEPLPLDEIERMMDHYQEAEGGRADILQISGGEPTTHPEIGEILRRAMARRFRCVMLNTNGLRLAEDDAFLDELAALGPGFEVYLQFDGLDDAATAPLRGRGLAAVKKRVVDRLGARNVPVTLVATIAAGINDHEVGAIFAYAASRPGVRGVNFQPRAYFGRGDGTPGPDRVTLTGVLRRLERQTTGMIRRDDFVPLPCDVERVAVSFFRRESGDVTPFFRGKNFADKLPFVANTLAFDTSDVLRQAIAGMASGGGVCNCLSFIQDVAPLAPLTLALKPRREQARFVSENIFRVTVTSFVDRFNFEARAMRKECVHVLTRDGRRMPFSAFNLVHRPETA